jgi:hypothetical protein
MIATRRTFMGTTLLAASAMAVPCFSCAQGPRRTGTNRSSPTWASTAAFSTSLHERDRRSRCRDFVQLSYKDREACSFTCGSH